jgi:hypothetical protein
MLAATAFRLSRANALRSGALAQGMGRQSLIGAAARPIALFEDLRYKSTATNPGFIEKPLKYLDKDAVNRIKAELDKVDANADGRYDKVCL